MSDRSVAVLKPNHPNDTAIDTALAQCQWRRCGTIHTTISGSNGRRHAAIYVTRGNEIAARAVIRIHDIRATQDTSPLPPLTLEVFDFADDEEGRILAEQLSNVCEVRVGLHVPRPHLTSPTRA